MQAQSVIEWPKPFIEYIGFVASFFLAGAIGFRYAVLRAALARAANAGAAPAPVYADSARRAAVIGLTGAVIALALFLYGLPGQASRRHLTAFQFATTTAAAAMQIGFLIVALIGFAIAQRGAGAGWPLAAIGVVAGALRNAFLGQWATLVNPIHVLAGGLWIGTLFVLVVAGISSVLRDVGARDRRGAIIADMVNSFSSLALAAAGTLAMFGVITAWRHLHVLSNLWATPYGIALIVKLCLVATVVALGAWNWRRQRPTLGSEPAALAIRRSASAELTMAAIVLAASAVLVSIPAPRRPRPPGAPAPTAPASGAAAPGASGPARSP